MKTRFKDITFAALTADAFALGAHWIYDVNQIASLKLSLDKLSNPQGGWHKNRRAGQFTHYGDQLVMLHEFIQAKSAFSATDWARYWESNMRAYDGYMDHSTKETLAIFDRSPGAFVGAASSDLSIAGRIAPLLSISTTKEQFLKNADAFAGVTHNSAITRAATSLIADLLWQVISGAAIKDALSDSALSRNPAIAGLAEAAMRSTDGDTVPFISQFGQSCAAAGGLPGALHLVLKYGDNFKEAMVNNRLAGGDSSARGMVAAILMTAAHGIEIVPESWRKEVEYRI